MTARWVLAALLCAALSPCPAAAQPKPADQSSARTADTAAAVTAGQSWLEQVAAFTASYSAVLLREEQALGTINAGAGQALEFYNHNQIKPGAAWALSWARARRLDLAGVQAANDGLPKYPPPLPVEIAALASLQRMDRGLREVVTEQAELGKGAVELGQELTSLAEKTASGDAAAAAELTGRRFDVVVINLRGENALMQTSNAMIEAGSPQIDLQRSIIETNLAMIAMMQVRKSLALQEGRDLQPLIAEMRQHAQAAASAAQQVPLDAESTLAAAQANSALAGTPLLARIEKATQTYAESSQVEQSVAEVALAVADSFGKEKTGGEAAAAAALARLPQLVQRRVELDQRRKQILAGQD
jgi:hypothetical protein